MAPAGAGVHVHTSWTERVERPDFFDEKILDAAHPPTTFAEIVRLMSGWAAALQAGGQPVDLADVRFVAKPSNR
jgi:hypothetical protein